MGMAGRIAGVLLLLVLAAVVVGCGGGSEGDETAAGPQRLYPRVHGPSREFLVRGGDNIVQFYGHEGTPAEREGVSKVVHAWMKARVAEDWVADCRYLSDRYQRTLAADANRVTDGKAKTCPQALEYFGPSASGKLVNNLDGPIDSLRIRRIRGYVQYHGNDGHDWILPVRRENGEWRVESAAPLGRSR